MCTSVIQEHMNSQPYHRRVSILRPDRHLTISYTDDKREFENGKPHAHVHCKSFPRVRIGPSSNTHRGWRGSCSHKVASKRQWNDAAPTTGVARRVPLPGTLSGCKKCLTLCKCPQRWLVSVLAESLCIICA
jgi:hypothetical protein